MEIKGGYTMKTAINRHIILALSLIPLVMLIFGAAHAADDYQPCDPVKLGNPNIMFIFDNSESMVETPYLKPDSCTGNLRVKPGDGEDSKRWPWFRGVQTDDNGNILVDENCDPIFDENAHQEKKPVFIPEATVNTISNEVTSNNSSPSKILKDTTDTANLAGLNKDDFLYQLMKISYPDTPALPEQTLTITNLYTSAEYWTLSENIPYDGLKNNERIKYEILDKEQPTITHFRGESYMHWPTDGYVDWASVNNNKDYYIGKLFRLTSGPNAGRELEITGINVGYKVWQLEAALTQEDFGQTYEIVGSEGDGYYASGGNHPASKMYQAKKAVETFLKGEELKDDSGKYTVNFGFSTYMSLRTPMTKALYYVQKSAAAEEERCKAYYYSDGTHSETFYHFASETPEPTELILADDNGDAITDADGNSVGTITKLGSPGDIPVTSGTTNWDTSSWTFISHKDFCQEYSGQWYITAIEYDPDGETPRWAVRATRLYKNIHYIDIPLSEVGDGLTDCADCATAAMEDYPETYGGKTRFDVCWSKNLPYCADATDPITWHEYDYYYTIGDYSVTTSGQPGYIYDTYQTKTVTKPDGTARTLKYLVEPHKTFNYEGTKTLVENTITKPFFKQGYELTIYPDMYDASEFVFPGETAASTTAGDTSKKPFTWSYRKTADLETVFTPSDTDKPWTPLSVANPTFVGASEASSWSNSIQKTNYFPAVPGTDPPGILTGQADREDHMFFINLPAYDSSDEYEGDDVNGDNIADILPLVSTDTAGYPGDLDNDTRYMANNSDFRTKKMTAYLRDNKWHTMMPYTDSLPDNTYMAAPGKSTPLAGALIDAKRYYESYFEADSEDYSKAGCRKNFVILLTDGAETCDGDPVAAAEDLRDIHEGKGVDTFVVGFGLDSDSQDSVELIAQAGVDTSDDDYGYLNEDGDMQYAYFADDIDELMEALYSIFNIVNTSGGGYTRSSPKVTRKLPGQEDIKLYYGYFDYPGWIGHLYVRHLDATGNVIDWDTKRVNNWSPACDGDAGCEMSKQNPANRTIYTSTGADMTSPTRTDFIQGNASTLRQYMGLTSEDVDGNGTDNEDNDASEVIGFIRDPTYSNGEYAGTRYVDDYWPLGDIIHSEPIMVPPPAFDSDREGYDTFKSDNAGRDTMVYIGSNAGMLHAINDDDGKEDWAYIPNCILDDLHHIRNGHQLTVDGRPRVADVVVPAGNKSEWKTVLASGLRQGGNHYFALDITDPADPTPMWEITDSNMGQTWSTPSFGRIWYNGELTSVIFVGGGYDVNSSIGNRVYIIRISDGSILADIELPGAGSVPADMVAWRYPLKNGSPYDYRSGKFFTDEEYFGADKIKSMTDGSNQADETMLIGNIDVLYVGSTSGTIYRIYDLNKATGWDPQYEKLYQPPADRAKPVYHSVAVSDQSDCRFVLWGTGDENNIDPDATQQHYFTEIQDRDFDASEGGPDFETTDDGTGQFRLTWFQTLPANQAVLSDPAIYNGVVYFTTYDPDQGKEDLECGQCTPGESYLWGLKHSTCSKILDGENPDNPGLEYGPDGELDAVEKSVSLGEGISTDAVPTPGKTFVTTTGAEGEEGASGMGPQIVESRTMKAGKLIYWYEGYY